MFSTAAALERTTALFRQCKQALRGAPELPPPRGFVIVVAVRAAPSRAAPTQHTQPLGFAASHPASSCP
jgi:hypothetical protein